MARQTNLDIRVNSANVVMAKRSLWSVGQSWGTQGLPRISTCHMVCGSTETARQLVHHAVLAPVECRFNASSASPLARYQYQGPKYVARVVLGGALGTPFVRDIPSLGLAASMRLPEFGLPT